MTVEIIPIPWSRIPVPAGAGDERLRRATSGKKKQGDAEGHAGGGSASGPGGYQQRDAEGHVAGAGGAHGVVDGVGVGSAEGFIADPAAGACSHDEEECDDGIEYIERVISSLAGYDIAAQRREEATASWVRSLGGPS